MFSLHLRLRRHIGVLCFALASLVLVVSASAAQAAFSGQNGTIAFTRCDDTSCSIWTMDADGTHSAQLTPGSQQDLDPAYSAGCSFSTAEPGAASPWPPRI
jgi:hypothetical protein